MSELGDIEGMVQRLRGGEIRALARAVSLVEDSSAVGTELVRACRKYAGGALRIGVTGPPGAGKSTLVDQMAKWLRQEGQTVGVVAVDPSSPYTGGALLGDRIRMQDLSGDAGVYVRSMASRGAKGGLAAAVEDVCVVMAAAGRQVILIETMGVGQDEVEVARLADVTVLVLVPGMGDEVQSLKAGVMEVADVFVVNKSDRDGAEQVETEILAMQGLGADEPVSPVVRTVATTGVGVSDLMAAVQWCAAETRGKKQRIVTGTEGLLIDHLGVAVRDMDAARDFYEALGLTASHEETVEHEKVRVAMLPLGESRIELLEATEPDSVIERFIAKRGEGLHHVAIRVGDVDAMFERLRLQGVRLASDAVRVGAGGHRYFFVHPESTGGVLLEIVDDMAGKGK
ncbi:methylmalonyl Co-A mutase-associated GTPase MeaB [Edaphobacter dinghuensis]|uniref:methylmalonyl Co-A mutase-associated GTPase MeaB n=2 Tax=Edaphobacter dinghuensis TaxID=1560005 RepID=UPI001E480AB3|nr:methylmalonyl Co-A mutase-associated GTPase MeaB [Edaphobacter dinghuensis]